MSLLLTFLEILALLFKSSHPEITDQRIIGGMRINIEKAPYQAAVYLNEHFICGGSVISERFVLSAAHCE